MKTEGKITMLVSAESTTIRVKDPISNIEFIEITLTPEQLSAALSRQAHTPCIFEVRGLDSIGKKHENKQFGFVIPESFGEFNRYKERDIKHLQELGQYTLDKQHPNEGWILESYFGSKDSFFEKDGVKWARATIRRWV